MASPNRTAAFQSQTNATLAASATTSALTWNFTAGDWWYDIYVVVTFGTVATTSGLQVNIYKGSGATPTYATTPDASSFLIPSTASTTTSILVSVAPGPYQIKLTNLDATNGVTNANITADQFTQ